jgi:hypothetical protein
MQARHAADYEFSSEIVSGTTQAVILAGSNHVI